MLQPSHLTLSQAMLALSVLLFPFVHEAVSKPSQTLRKAPKAAVSPKSPLASGLRSALRQRAIDTNKRQFDLAESLMWAHSSASVGQLVACGGAMQGLKLAQVHNTMAKAPLREMTKDMAYNLARLAQHHRSLAKAPNLKNLSPLHQRLATFNAEGSRLAEQMTAQVQGKGFDKRFNDLQRSISAWSGALSVPKRAKEPKIALATGLRTQIRQSVKRHKASELASRVLSGTLLLAVNQANHVHYALTSLAKSREHSSTRIVRQYLIALRVALESTRLALDNLAAHRAMKAMAQPLGQLVSIYNRGERACAMLVNWLDSKGSPKAFDNALESYRSALQNFTESLQRPAPSPTKT